MRIGNIILKLEENIYLVQFKKVLRLCMFGYQKMIEKPKIDLKKSKEDNIRNFLLVDFLEKDNNKQLFGLNDCTFSPGKDEVHPETYETIGRLDISIRVADELGGENHYTIECKIIDKPATYIDSRENNQKVAGEKGRTNGIMSFITGKYAGEMPVAGMIGFNKTGDINRRIKKIKNLVEQRQKEGGMINIQNLEKYEIAQDFEHSYKSSHQRDRNLGNIDIYHLFFDFAD